jgi:hypothetical protein
MKTLELTTLLLAIGLIFGSTSCKYEEGPILSLRTKKDRIAGDWVIEKTIESDGTEDTDWDGVEVTFDKDGTGKSSYTYTIFGVSTTQTTNFNWEFTDSKKKLKITTEDGDVDESTILKLKNDEMWVIDTDNFQTNFKSK